MIIDPGHFSSQDFGPPRGLGLVANIDLKPGDIWWQHDWSDPRYVARLIPWIEYEAMSTIDRAAAERLCYLDIDRRTMVLCTEPFCRVNHSALPNSITNADGDSEAIVTIPAGREITISYEYESVLSLVWKFDGLRAMLPGRKSIDEWLIVAKECPTTMAYLKQLT
jgi:hypothetical protein